MTSILVCLRGVQISEWVAPIMLVSLRAVQLLLKPVVLTFPKQALESALLVRDE